MKDNCHNNLQFVKIVERFPVLYDNKMPHRTQVCAVAWEKVAESVRREIKEPCTVDELKNKWKGIRSSFNRFKRRIHLEKTDVGPRQYYLYEALAFLHKHTRPKWQTENEEDNSDNDEDWPKRSIKVELVPIRTYKNNRDPLSVGKKLSLQTSGSEHDLLSPVIKVEPLDEEITVNYADFENDTDAFVKEEDELILKRKDSVDDTSEAASSKMRKIEDGTDMQFFKSILPDVSHFTTQEKRKFKMGVLKLIDEIEESRKQS